MNSSQQDFYVGYLPKAPTSLAHYMRRAVIVLFAITAAVSLLLVVAQRPFPNSKFEFGNYQTYEGTISARPYPFLSARGTQYLLIGPGKHGAGPMVRGYDGTRAELTAARIERDGRVLLELKPESIKATAGVGGHSAAAERISDVRLTGEIVDSKCYLGVMNPGNGKVHRDCAARCISGGVPPAFIARDADGETRFMLLTGVDGEPLRREVLDFVAEPITVQGVLTRVGELLVLRADPKLFRRGTE